MSRRSSGAVRRDNHLSKLKRRCPTGKKRFRDEDRALQELARIDAKRADPHRVETRVHECPRCGQWHLTSGGTSWEVRT